jgi:hypothetical protein
VWDDGHKWCFGCKYYEPATRTLSQQRQEDYKKDNLAGYHFTEQLPNEAIAYLRKYGISDNEVKEVGFLFETRRALLTVPFYDSSGGLTGFSGRGFSGSGPRYCYKGDKWGTIRLFGRAESEVLVVVEDIVSAIKVGRVYATLPCFGSDIPLEALQRAARRFERVAIWLDRDMATKASRIALKGRFLTGKDIYAVITEEDPKVYDTSTIRRLVDREGS